MNDIRYRIARALFLLAARIYPMTNKKRSGFGLYIGNTNLWLEVMITRRPGSEPKTFEDVVNRSGRWSR
jgi:hypothetical protein